MADGTAEIKIDQTALQSDDIGEVGNALAGLFADPKDEIPEDQPQEAEDTEQAETPAIGEHDDGHSEQSEEATAIEPPSSWTADAKEWFAQLPPNVQQYVATRESERETFLNTQSQKASEAQRQLDAERQALANDRANQARLFQSILLQLSPEFQQYQNIDWSTLAREKPAEWAHKRQAFDDLQMRWNNSVQQLQSLEQANQAEQQKASQTRLKEEFTKLTAAVPEFADRANLRTFHEDLVKYLPEVTKDEWAAIGDHRQLLIARDAMQFRKQAALRAQAQTQNRRQPAPQKPQLRPTARQGTASEDAQNRRMDALHGNLRKSGRLDDAAALLAESGIFGKA